MNMSNDKTKTEETKRVSELTLDELETASGGIGNVIASTYRPTDGNGVAAFYAGICMGLMGF
jgi:hypothetical protein